MNIGDRATKLAEQREAARRIGDSLKVAQLTREMNELYAEKRRRVATGQHGSSNEQIVKRARIETELERLMSDNGRKQR